MLISPEWFGLMEATSKDGEGVVGCWAAGCWWRLCMNPWDVYEPEYHWSANCRDAYSGQQQLSAETELLRRALGHDPDNPFFEAAPVTPETKASGDSRQNSQAFRMLSA